MFTSLSPYLVNIQSDDPEQNLTIIFTVIEDNTDWLHSHHSHHQHFSFFSIFPHHLNILEYPACQYLHKYQIIFYILSFNNSINNNHLGSWKLIMNRQTRSYFVWMIICLSMKDINQNVYLNQKMEVTDGILRREGGVRILMWKN